MSLRAHVGPARATFAAWCVGGAVSGLLVACSVPLGAAPWLGRRVALHLLDAGNFLALGLALAGWLALWLRGAPGPLRRPWLAWAVVALPTGALVLPDDLSFWAHRATVPVSPWLLEAAAIALVAAAVPLAWLVGVLCRRRPWTAAPAAVAALTLLAAHPFALRGDYPALHLFAALAACALGAALLERVARAERLERWLARRERPATVTLALLASLASVSVVLWPPSALAVDRLAAGSAVLPPFLGRIHVARAMPETTIPAELAPWFSPRAHLPAQAPTLPRVLPPDGIVVLVGIDAVRADLLSSGRYDAELPNLARLRGQSTWFTGARSPGSQTTYALGSLMAGTYFSQQLWTPLDRGMLWPHEDPTPRFPELLARGGVTTAHVAGAEWMVGRYGIVRGFTEERWLRSSARYTGARSLVEAAIHRLQQHDAGPLFLFLHLLDPHAPYDTARKDGSPFERYLAEVAAVDRELGRLLGTLRHPELSRRTALLVFSDHGEAFGEHGREQHATSLYDELLRVPLLVKLPHGAPREIAEPVSLVDVGPTVLDLFGLPTPSHAMGQSLLPLVRGEPASLTRPIVAEGRLKQSLVTREGMKVIVDNRHFTIELYDLRSDPGELCNLADDEGKLTQPLGLLRAFFATHTRREGGYRVPYRR